jgi:eukaryotic-like serine/threonine-protein kinase
LKPAVQPSREDVRDELKAICAHDRFARSGRLSQFLRFIVEQRLLGRDVNEQIIGVNVFGREAGYDSGNDTIVRTEAVALRRRLEDYYRANPNARVRISVLRGGYNPTFTWVNREDESGPADNAVAPAEIPQASAEDAEEQAIAPDKGLSIPESKRFVPRWRVVMPATLAVAAIVVGLLFWRSRQTVYLAGNRTIVVSEFANTTGDSVFDGALKQALTIQLEQSPFLNVLSEAKVAATLKLMARPTSERLTEQVAQEVCQRTNSQALLVGSISRVGNPYLIAVKAVNCQSGDTLASAEAEVPNRDNVLNGVQRVGNELRRKLGESLASMEKFNKPLDEATTSSLEALKTVTEGMRLRVEGGFLDITPYFKRAIDLDPNFALAHAALGVYYANSGRRNLAQEYLSKAFELRGRTSERERFFIEAAYYEHTTGELERSIQTYTEFAEAYPLVATPRINLGNAYFMLGQYEKSVAETREALRLNPDAGTAYSNLTCAYVCLDRLREARAVYDQAQMRKLDSFYLRQARYGLAFVEEDETAMQEQVTWGTGKLTVEDYFLSTEADTEAYHGRLAKARELTAQAIESAKRSNVKETAALWSLSAALREAEFGNAALARQYVKQAMTLSAGRDLEVLAGLALSRAGDSGKAREILKNLDHQFPVDTLLQHYWFPTIRGALDLNKDNAQGAVDALQNESAYDLAQPPPFQLGPMYPVYIRGLAYLRMREARSAAGEFRKIVEHRGVGLNSPLGALAHVQLARALGVAGDTEGARKEYQDFFALWKDADPDVPIRNAATAEYSKLL